MSRIGWRCVRGWSLDDREGWCRFLMWKLFFVPFRGGRRWWWLDCREDMTSVSTKCCPILIECVGPWRWISTRYHGWLPLSVPLDSDNVPRTDVSLFDGPAIVVEFLSLLPASEIFLNVSRGLRGQQILVDGKLGL